jgi:hypothetical protein
VREDDLKSTFEQLRAAPMPVRALTADDVISSGEAVRKRRRTMAVVGSGVGTTAVVVAAVLALALKPGDAPTGPVEPAGPSSTSSVRKPAEVSPPVTPLPQAPVQSSPDPTPTTPPSTTSTTSPAFVPSTSAPEAPEVTTTTTIAVTTTVNTPLTTNAG